MDKLNKVYAHAVVLPASVCKEICKVVKLTAVSEDGKKFEYEPDLSNYPDSGLDMWLAFVNFCKKCGLGDGYGQVWFDDTELEEADESLRCNPCSIHYCINLYDEFLGCTAWDTVLFRQQYGFRNFMRPEMKVDEFYESCGYKKLTDAEDLYAVCKAYEERIEKPTFSEDECVALAAFIRENVERIYHGPNVRAILDYRIYIAVALLRLARSSEVIFEECVDFLCADALARGNGFEVLYDLFQTAGMCYDEDTGNNPSCDIPGFFYTEKNGGLLRGQFKIIKEEYDS